MILFDVNILIYAHRNDQRHHAAMRKRFEQSIQHARVFGLTHAIAGAYVRIVTQPNFPNGPTPLSQALAHIDHIVRQPHFSWCIPGTQHWSLVEQLCRSTHTYGKSVADAQHAATAIESSAVWVSADTDFNQFKEHGLRFEHWNVNEHNTGPGREA